MGSCHSITYANGLIIGDPLEIKMIHSINWSFQDNINQSFGESVIGLSISNNKFNNQKIIGNSCNFNYKEKTL